MERINMANLGCGGMSGAINENVASGNTAHPQND
jgi:hypothetical protein